MVVGGKKHLKCNGALQVLSIMWGLETEEAEDVLQEFVNKSLLFRDCHHRPYRYYLHDLQLDFLAEQNRSQIEVRPTVPLLCLLAPL